MTTPTLDAIDRKLLTVLQQEGRITAQDLAERVGLTASPCLRRIRLLEEAGVIRRYVAVVDQKAVGLPVSVFVSVKLERQREEELDRFAAAIARWPEVLECYLMTGPRDYLLRVVVPDLEAYEAFLKGKLTRLDGVQSIESSFALGQVKYTSVLPIA
jgi:Lrp/AsnC family leucine-responsive transcriptional regulator